jgi:predicted HAD superfamily Cof-like phosphohydrolase
VITKVKQFNDKFGLPSGQKDVLSNDKALQDFRIGFLNEELCELLEALEKEDRVAAFDALLDLVYVAHGTALALGISVEQWHSGMIAVHRCNMSKVKVENVSESKRGHASDLRKPAGWVGPEEELAKILSW